MNMQAHTRTVQSFYWAIYKTENAFLNPWLNCFVLFCSSLTLGLNTNVKCWPGCPNLHARLPIHRCIVCCALIISWTNFSLPRGSQRKPSEAKRDERQESYQSYSGNVRWHKRNPWSVASRRVVVQTVTRLLVTITSVRSENVYTM